MSIAIPKDPDDRSITEDIRGIIEKISNLKKDVLTADPDLNDVIIFSLFLVVFPVVTTLYYIFFESKVFISIPLLLMFLNGLLSFRATKELKKKRGA